MIEGVDREIIALERGRDGKHDIGMACGWGPHLFVHDHTRWFCPGGAESIEILVMMERIAACPVDEFDMRIVQTAAVVVERRSGFLQHVGYARHRDYGVNWIIALREACPSERDQTLADEPNAMQRTDPMADEEAKVIVLRGVNSASTSVHAMPFIREARVRGCTVLAVDPRPTRTTAQADWHLQPRPGTDTALALGIMRILVERGLHDADFLARHTRGWRELIETRLPDYPLMAYIAANWHPAQRFEFVPMLSEEPSGSSWTGARERVTARLRSACLACGLAQTSSMRAWLCGPPPMVEAGHALLREYGVPAANIARDLFTDLRSPAPILDNQRCMLCDECRLVRPVAACIVEAATVELAPDGRMRAYTPIVPRHTAGLYYHRLAINDDQCIRCYACVQACPHAAISLRE